MTPNPIRYYAVLNAAGEGVRPACLDKDPTQHADLLRIKYMGRR